MGERYCEGLALEGLNDCVSGIPLETRNCVRGILEVVYNCVRAVWSFLTKRIRRRERIRQLKIKLKRGIIISEHMAIVLTCSKCWKDKTLKELSEIQDLEGININPELLNNSGENGISRFVYVCPECDEFEWKSFTPKTTTISHSESQFTQFASKIFEVIKLEGDPSSLYEHNKYIESNIVKEVCDKFEVLFPTFKLEKYILRNGSFYHKTKLFQPDEFDYLAPLKLCEKRLRGDNTIQLQDEDFCRDIAQECNNLDSEAEKNVIDKEQRLTSWIMYYIHKAIDTTLKRLHEEEILTYKGILFIGNKKPADSGLATNEIILDDELHGPCIRLRVGAELCATDIDIGFCVLKDPHISGDINNIELLLPGSDEFWIQSTYCRRSRIDGQHRKLVMLLKYVMSVCNRDGSCLTNLSSHAFKCHVYAHQKECEYPYNALRRCFYNIRVRTSHLRCINTSQDRHANDTSLGRCLHDILVRISHLICMQEWNTHFRFESCCLVRLMQNNRHTSEYQPVLTDNGNTYDVCRKRRWIGKLPDVDSNNRNLLEYSPWLMDQLFVRVLFKWLGESLDIISEDSTGGEYRQAFEHMCAQETREFVNELGDEYNSCQEDPFEVLKQLQGKHFKDSTGAHPIDPKPTRPKHFKESKDHSIVNIDSRSGSVTYETSI
ncbi:unnamed protein product [Owenia fusiformis]|uniref:Uncharacterized protein n=1 Tax=Owenia fusiformis TaxID=6347 RepID=A0A8J1Y1M0_OWEFU|nr:unnamed protein product [Owenia fusiformis]